MQMKVTTVELHTFCQLWLGTHGVTKQVRIFGGNVDLVSFHGLLVKPQETGVMHVGQKYNFVFVTDVFPVRVVLSICAELVGVLAFSLMATEVQADACAVLEFAFKGEGFGNRSPFFDVGYPLSGICQRFPFSSSLELGWRHQTCAYCLRW
jgi:hypothetical protein